MKTTIVAVSFALCILGLFELASAEGVVQVRPVDFYASGFGGYSFPEKTNFSSGGITATDAAIDNSPSFGGKVGMWFTAPRKVLGIDLGLEFDATHFNPDIPSGQILQSNVGLVSPVALDLNATYYGIHILARVPVDVTPEYQNGRWFPYIGVGGGGQRFSYQAAGTTEGSDTTPALQALGGLKVFLSKHVAVFAEGKYIRARPGLKFQGALGAFEVDLDVYTAHGVGGLSVHF